MIQATELERKAKLDFELHNGLDILVDDFSGYLYDNSIDFFLDEPVVMRLTGGNVNHWGCAEWLDPYWNLEWANPTDSLEKFAKVTSFWTHGPSYNTDGETERGQLKLVNNFRNRFVIKWRRFWNRKFKEVQPLPFALA